MAESKATVPHFYLATEIDMTEAVAVRAQLKQIAGEDRPAPDLQRHGREGLRAARCASSRARTAPTATATSSSTPA